MKLSRLVPMQPVKSMPVAVAFYEKLGFVVETRKDEWGWAMLRCGDCQLMLDQSINPHPGIPRVSVLYLYPENLQEFHRHAQENGLSVPELDATFYGMTEFRIEDPDGNRLWIGQDKGVTGDALRIAQGRSLRSRDAAKARRPLSRTLGVKVQRSGTLNSPIFRHGKEIE